MSDLLFVVILAISSLAIAVIAFVLAILEFRRLAGPMRVGTRVGSRERDLEAASGSGAKRISIRRANVLAEAAVMLGAEALMIFDQRGLVVETYNMSEGQAARTAASLAELISMLRSLGLPTETLIFKDEKIIMVVELRRMGDVTPYCLIVGRSSSLKNAEHAREILQDYIVGVIRRGWASWSPSARSSNR